MNKLRSHIMRLCVIVLLFAGFSLYMARPAQAEQSSQAFTRWFGALAKSEVDSGLQKELDSFIKSEAQLDKLIAKASQIVSRYDEEFNFPFSESVPSQHVYQLLLIEWAQYQTGNEMAAIPSQSNVKPAVLFSSDTLGGFGITSPAPRVAQITAKAQGLNVIPQINHSVSVSPMSSGIAICAP